MRVTFASSLGFGLVVLVATSVLSSTGLHAQAPKPAPRPAAQAKAPTGSPATVLRVMRGILFPSSNVIFAAQSDDPDKVPKAKDASLATNPLASTYGGWEAVANASIAMQAEPAEGWTAVSPTIGSVS